MEFLYTNRGTMEAPALTTNLISLRWDGPKLIYGRRYVSKNGVVDDNVIEHTFEGVGDNRITAYNVAKNIHWGCCGWSVGSHQIGPLKEIVEKFLEKTQ